MLYLHVHNSATKIFSVLLNSASRKYPRGSVAKLVDVSKMCRSVKSWIKETFFFFPPRVHNAVFFFCGEHWEALR